MPAAENAPYPDDLPKKSREPEPRLEESRRKELRVENNQDADHPARVVCVLEDHLVDLTDQKELVEPVQN